MLKKAEEVTHSWKKIRWNDSDGIEFNVYTGYSRTRVKFDAKDSLGGNRLSHS